MSPRITAPNHTLAFSPSSTSPITFAAVRDPGACAELGGLAVEFVNCHVLFSQNLEL